MSWENKVSYNRDECKVYMGRNHCCTYQASAAVKQELVEIGPLPLWTHTNESCQMAR